MKKTRLPHCVGVVLERELVLGEHVRMLQDEAAGYKQKLDEVLFAQNEGKDRVEYPCGVGSTWAC